MRFAELLSNVRDEPLFETGLLLAGDRDPRDVRRQLSRWVADGRIYRLRRGLYALAPPYASRRPHPFLVANHLQRGSYVSLQSALAHHGLIPEHVPVTTSVGAGDTLRRENPIGSFDFRHLAPPLLTDYSRIEVAEGQWAFVAQPEKAILDLVYLVPGGDRWNFLSELRLQNLDHLDPKVLSSIAERVAKPKLRRAAQHVIELAQAETAEFVAV